MSLTFRKIKYILSKVKENFERKVMNNILSLETNKYALRLDNFEGPLDLLCYLIDKKQNGYL